MGIFNLFRSGQPEPKKAKETSKVKTSKEKCSNCCRPFGKQRIYYTYPGKTKGDLEITEERLLCRNCLEKKYEISDSKIDTEKTASIVLALQLKDKTKLEKALRDWDEEGKRQGEDSTYWYTRGNILANLSDVQKALKSYDEALFLDTHYVKAWYRKGWVLVNAKKYKEAIACFENILVLEKWLKSEIEIFMERTMRGEQVDFNELLNEVATNNKLRGSKGWSQAALVSQTYALMLHANASAGTGTEITEQEAEKTREYIVCSYLVLNAYPSILDKVPNIAPARRNWLAIEMPDFILNNIRGILKLVEPNVVAHVGLGWEKH